MRTDLDTQKDTREAGDRFQDSQSPRGAYPPHSDLRVRRLKFELVNRETKIRGHVPGSLRLNLPAGSVPIDDPPWRGERPWLRICIDFPRNISFLVFISELDSSVRSGADPWL